MNMKRLLNFSILIKRSGLLLYVVLSACKSIPIVPVIPEEKDSGPERPVSVSHISEPVPVMEPRTNAGNSSPYKVLGQTYYVLQNPEGYKDKGTASWYGRKFHGRRTANGEIYDMFAMTGAHKTLPIPSYVRVTNLVNKHSVVVRINDRGPFHSDRLIDLSYTAAKKLGFENVGTAKVAIEYIDPLSYQHNPGVSTKPLIASTATGASKPEPLAPTPERAGGYRLPDNTWLQVGAFGQLSSAQQMKLTIEKLTSYQVVILEPKSNSTDKLFRVRVGPLKDNFDLLELRRRMQEQNLPDPHVIYN